ncbi:MAG: hypothetical protein MJ124_01540 [Lachnospiraceae bacterium]|nr:hypothetical protein [Lachnospiraceae bacterium]
MQAQAVRNYNAYDSAYEAGYNAALEAMTKARKSRQYITEYKAEAEAKARQEKTEYFLKQKLAGGVLLAVSAVGLAITGGEFAIAIAAIPAGLLFLLTKHRLFG